MDAEKIVSALSLASLYGGSEPQEGCRCFGCEAKRALPIAQHLSETLPKIREALECFVQAEELFRFSTAYPGDGDMWDQAYEQAREALRALTKGDGNDTND